MNNLEMDIKQSLDALYKNPNLDTLFAIGNRIVDRNKLIEILEIKLLKILNEKVLGVSSCIVN
jgi:hypothetical protein